MSRIYICPLSDVHQHAATVEPSHVISLLGDDPFPETPPGVADACHLRLRFHDIDVPMPGYHPPEAHHIEEIIAFGGAWQRTEHAPVGNMHLQFADVVHVGAVEYQHAVGVWFVFV